MRLWENINLFSCIYECYLQGVHGVPYIVSSRAPPQAQARASELEVISQQVEEDNQCQNPVQLGSFAYRDLPLAALDISLAGSQLISNLDEEDNREG